MRGMPGLPFVIQPFYTFIKLVSMKGFVACTAASPSQRLDAAWYASSATLRMLQVWSMVPTMPGGSELIVKEDFVI